MSSELDAIRHWRDDPRHRIQSPWRWVDLLLAEIDRRDTILLEAIVRDLAAASPDGAIFPHGDADDPVYACILCGCERDSVSDHHHECEWRRAVEWVAAHPTDEGDGE